MMPVSTGIVPTSSPRGSTVPLRRRGGFIRRLRAQLERLGFRPGACGLIVLGLLGPFEAGPASAQGHLGVSSVGGQLFHNEDLGSYEPETDDLFGWALATGDFNGDGVEDLATGIPHDNGPVGAPLPRCGAVVVRYGITGAGLATGLATTFLNQLLPGGPDPAEAIDSFGSALATGDFNRDGIDDLAVGVPGNDTGASGAGGVAIHYGLPGGIQLVAEHFLRQGANGVPGSPGFDFFGWSLAAGDFNGDGYDDLAVGATGEQNLQFAGNVTVFHGGIGGLLPFAGYVISQADPLIPDDAETGDVFGFALAAGDYDGSGHDDLAIGVPYEDDVGAVLVLFGSELGLLFANNVWWGQGDIGGANEAGDVFGSSLASGDFDGDGFDELVIGHPAEDLGVANEIGDAGEVVVLYGSPNGPPNWFNLSRTQFLTQGSIYGVPADDQAGDAFGLALAAGDFDGDGRDDLAIGHPYEDIPCGGICPGVGGDEGAVTVLIGAPVQGLFIRFGILAAGQAGIPGGPAPSAHMGHALATGDFDGSGFSDLAIGIPYLNANAIVGTGGEIVLYGSLFANGFELGLLCGGWSYCTP